MTHENVLADEGERRRRIGLVFLDFDGGDLGAGADLAGREHRGSDAVGGVGDGCDGGGHDGLRRCKMDDREQKSNLVRMTITPISIPLPRSPWLSLDVWVEW